MLYLNSPDFIKTKFVKIQQQIKIKFVVQYSAIGHNYENMDIW